MKKALLVFSTLLLPHGFNAKAEDLPLQSKVIVVDAGHGTVSFERDILNGGKQTLDGLPEHRLTAVFAERVAAELEKAGAEVYLTRSEKEPWRFGYNSVDDNKARAIFANALSADLLLSMHCDWHPNRSVEGVTTLYAARDSAELARSIQDAMVEILKARDRRAVRNDFTILDHALMPAVIIETGFMSHPEEMKKLTNEAYQQRVAIAVRQGVQRFFN